MNQTADHWNMENIRMNRCRSIVLLSLSVALAGCGAQFVRQRAAFDFDCPESSIEVVDAGGGAAGAVGCGKKASYVFVSGVGWVRNSEIQARSRGGSGKSATPPDKAATSGH